MVFYALNTFLCLLLLSLAGSFFYNRSIISSKIMIVGITALCVVSVVMQRWIFGTLYLIDRTALFFYPLFILSLFFSLDDFPKRITSKAVVVLAIPFLINFILTANLYKTATWYFDAHSPEILSRLNEEGKKRRKEINIDFSWPFERSIGYYVNKSRPEYVRIVRSVYDRQELNEEADYYIYLSKSLEKVGYDASRQKILPLQWDTAFCYESEHIVVFANPGKIAREIHTERIAQ